MLNQKHMAAVQAKISASGQNFLEEYTEYNKLLEEF